MGGAVDCTPDSLLHSIDDYDYTMRCWRYGFVYDTTILTILNTHGVLAKLYRDRNITVTHADNMKSPVILANSSRVEDIQACQKCGIVTCKLWGESNWHFLRGVVVRGELSGLLPGRLPGNAIVRGSFYEYLQGPQAYERMMRNMFDNEIDPGSGWVRNGWYCRACTTEFVRANLLSWLIREEINSTDFTAPGTHELKENCWYGYQCRTMTHNPPHAHKLNHLCEPRPDKLDGH